MAITGTHNLILLVSLGLQINVYNGLPLCESLHTSCAIIHDIFVRLRVSWSTTTVQYCTSNRTLILQICSLTVIDLIQPRSQLASATNPHMDNLLWWGLVWSTSDTSSPPSSTYTKAITLSTSAWCLIIVCIWQVQTKTKKASISHAKRLLYKVKVVGHANRYGEWRPEAVSQRTTPPLLSGELQ